MFGGISFDICPEAGCLYAYDPRKAIIRSLRVSLQATHSQTYCPGSSSLGDKKLFLKNDTEILIGELCSDASLKLRSDRMQTAELLLYIFPRQFSENHAVIETKYCHA